MASAKPPITSPATEEGSKPLAQDRSGGLAGVILAAGESSRMGRDKALLPLGGESFLQHLIGIIAGQVSPLLIVLGYHAQEIERQIAAQLEAAQPQGLQGFAKGKNFIILRNPNYPQGQLSSLQVALRYLLATPASGLMVSLVDHPVITRRTVGLLTGRFHESGSPILIPTYGGRRGHPVIFARSVFQELLDAPLNEGARFVVHRHSAELELIEMEEPGVVVDVDYPEDYQKLLERRTIPGGGETV